ncbi:MAG: serine/threonine protein kinase [Deltaproteobacteria bacterium]|nr:serine/threonine protein kinase [Deltaproteobacteria bacterium]
MTDPTQRLCPRCEQRTPAEICPTCQEPTAPAVIDGRYALEGVLGRGGMGVVYRARQLAADRGVAVKIINTRDDGVVQRFMREARVTARLEHPNIIRVYDSGVSSDGMPFLVMEMLRGHDLRQELRRGKPLALPRAVGIATQALKALHVAHQQGMIHRDIKPANIFLHQAPDEPETAKVMDFGIAHVTQLDGESMKLTQTGVVLGTPAYMSPEQLQEIPLDGRTDIYSLGIVFYEMLTARAAFRADTPMGLAMKQMQAMPTPVAQLRPDLAGMPDVQKALDRLLAKNRDDRPVNALHAISVIQQLVPSPVNLSDPALLALRTEDFVAMGTSGQPAAPVPTDDGPTMRITPDLTALAPAPAHKPALPLLAGGAALVVLVLAAGAWALGRGPPAAEPSVVTAPAPLPPPPPAPTTVAISVRSNPPGALITVDNASWGPAPVTRTLPRGGGPVTLRAVREGHQPAMRELTPDHDHDVELVLTPVPVVQPQQPAPAKAAPPARKRAPRTPRTPEPSGELQPEEL